MKRLLKSWMICLLSLLILTTQQALTQEPNKTQALKKGQDFSVPYDGLFLSSEKGKALLVMGKDFKVCQKDRDQMMKDLDSCLESKQNSKWWNSTYFKVTLGLILGYTAAKVGE